MLLVRRSPALVALWLLSALALTSQALARDPEGGHPTVDVAGLSTAYMEAGEGPLVLMLHGFPDTPHTWDGVREAVAEAGYRCVTPWLPGYAPTAAPSDDSGYTPDALGAWALGLIQALGYEHAVVVGHDWGALTAYAAATLEPERVDQLITLAIPHPAILKPSLGEAWRARHFFTLSRRRAPKKMARDDFAMIDDIVARWSPAWDVPPQETDPVKDAASTPTGASDLLAYYRALAQSDSELLTQPISVDAVLFAGVTDGVTPLRAFPPSEAMFSGSFAVRELPGGHFAHREDPELFTRLLLEALAQRPGEEGGSRGPAEAP